jgi:hypothetical protein
MVPIIYFNNNKKKGETNNICLHDKKCSQSILCLEQLHQIKVGLVIYQIPKPFYCFLFFTTRENHAPALVLWMKLQYQPDLASNFLLRLYIYIYIYIYNNNNNQGIYQNNHLEGDQSEEEREGICYRT